MKGDKLKKFIKKRIKLRRELLDELRAESVDARRVDFLESQGGEQVFTTSKGDQVTMAQLQEAATNKGKTIEEVMQIMGIAQ